MSIIMASVDQRRAIIGVDSEAVDPEGNRYVVSKFLHVPVTNIGLAMRGNINSLLHVHSHVAAMRWSYDECVEQIPSLFFDRVHATLQEGRKFGVAEAYLPFARGTAEELLIAGFSEQSHRVEAVVAKVNADGMIVREITAYYFAPGRGPGDVEGLTAEREATFMRMAASLVSDEDVIRIAQWQIDVLRGITPQVVTGGSILVAEISRTAWTVRNLGRIGVQKSSYALADA